MNNIIVTKKDILTDHEKDCIYLISKPGVKFHWFASGPAHSKEEAYAKLRLVENKIAQGAAEVYELYASRITIRGGNDTIVAGVLLGINSLIKLKFDKHPKTTDNTSTI
jgi:hypothetical protein